MEKWYAVGIPNHFAHIISLSQNNWSKALYPVAKWVMSIGDKAIKVMKEIEQNTPNLAVSFGKVLESINVLEDMHAVADNVLSAEQKITAGLFQQKAREVARARYWQWVLMHPGLRDTHVHPSRGVVPPPFTITLLHFLSELRNISLSCSPAV
jgi:hypothetical protein